MREEIVTECENCPIYSTDYDECNLIEGHERLSSRVIMPGCPLKDGPITIRLSTDEKPGNSCMAAAY